MKCVLGWRVQNRVSYSIKLRFVGINNARNVETRHPSHTRLKSAFHRIFLCVRPSSLSAKKVSISKRVHLFWPFLTHKPTIFPLVKPGTHDVIDFLNNIDDVFGRHISVIKDWYFGKREGIMKFLFHKNIWAHFFLSATLRSMWSLGKVKNVRKQDLLSTWNWSLSQWGPVCREESDSRNMFNLIFHHATQTKTPLLLFLLLGTQCFALSTISLVMFLKKY